MATELEIKQFVAEWMNVGKIVMSPMGELRAQSLDSAYRYTPEYDKLWSYLWKRKTKCYLLGTTQTFDKLERAWELSRCIHCDLPVMLPIGYYPSQFGSEPCVALGLWPHNSFKEDEDEELEELAKTLDDLESKIEWMPHIEDGTTTAGSIGITSALKRDMETLH